MEISLNRESGVDTLIKVLFLAEGCKGQCTYRHNKGNVHLQEGDKLMQSTKTNGPGAVVGLGIQWRTQVPAFLTLLEDIDLYKICYILYITYTIMSERDLDYEEK